MYYIYCAIIAKINVMLRKNVSLEVQFLPSSTLRNRVKLGTELAGIWKQEKKEDALLC